MTLERVGPQEAFGQSGLLTVGCGFLHTMEVTEEGWLWSWGEGALGRLGHNDDEDRPVPVRVELEGLDWAKIVSSACGVAHSAAVTEDSSLYSWGAGSLMLWETQVLAWGMTTWRTRSCPTQLRPSTSSATAPVAVCRSLLC